MSICYQRLTHRVAECIAVFHELISDHRATWDLSENPDLYLPADHCHIHLQKQIALGVSCHQVVPADKGV
jgi:hypothetical protein